MEINQQLLSELVSLKDPNKIVVAVCYYFHLVITYNNQEYFDGSMNDVWGINRKNNYEVKVIWACISYAFRSGGLFNKNIYVILHISIRIFAKLKNMPNPYTP